MLAVGPILNVRFGPRPSHYAVSLLSAAAGAAFAIAPGSAAHHAGRLGYGSALLGYHYYTWAFIGFASPSSPIAAMLLFDRQFEDDAQPVVAGAFARTGVWLVIGLTARERDLDIAGMRVCCLPRQSGRLRAAQAHAMSGCGSLERPLSVALISPLSFRCAGFDREPGIDNLGTARVVYYV